MVRAFALFILQIIVVAGLRFVVLTLPIESLECPVANLMGNRNRSAVKDIPKTSKIMKVKSENLVFYFIADVTCYNFIKLLLIMCIIKMFTT